MRPVSERAHATAGVLLPSPPLAQDRLEVRPDGLVRIALKRAYADGTVAVDMDPLSLSVALCRLAASVPPPRFHTVKYVGVRFRRAHGGRGSRLA